MKMFSVGLAVLVVLFRQNLICQGQQQEANDSSFSTPINVDLSHGNIHDSLQKFLTLQLTYAKKIIEQGKAITISLNLVPPPNANKNILEDLQKSLQIIMRQLVPYALTTISLEGNESGGAFRSIKATLHIKPTNALPGTPTLPPSNLPEVDMTLSSSNLITNLQRILSNGLNTNGYHHNMRTALAFNMAFNVLPPAGVTQNYAQSHILKPLQHVLREIAPGAYISSLDVNTEEINSKIVRQTLRIAIRIEPSTPTGPNDVNVPYINLDTPGINVVNILQQAILKNKNPVQDMTFIIPFEVTPPSGSSPQQIEIKYVNPIKQNLQLIDPTGQMIKLTQRGLIDGTTIFTIHWRLPSNNKNPCVTCGN